jgi:hypothetical protein
MRRCAAGWDTACNWDLSMLNKVANAFEHALRSANIHANPFQPDALELLIQAGGGLPRTINHLAQRAMEAGAAQSSVDVTAAHVQAGTDRLPWLLNLLQEHSAV